MGIHRAAPFAVTNDGSGATQVPDRTNYYGQQAAIDGQGRLLIHPLLRKSAEVIGDVAVLGYLTYLEVWELDKFKLRMLSDPYTAEDEAAIARLGI